MRRQSEKVCLWKYKFLKTGEEEEERFNTFQMSKLLSVVSEQQSCGHIKNAAHYRLTGDLILSSFKGSESDLCHLIKRQTCTVFGYRYAMSWL